MMPVGEVQVQWDSDQSDFRESMTCLARQSVRTGSKFNVLVADDDKVILNLVGEMLEAIDCRVDKAEDGLGALACLSSAAYDLVLTDLTMPKLDGFSLACKIRECALGPRIAVMTGRCPAEVAEMMDSEMVDTWLFKPFGIDALIGLLDNLTGQD